MDAIKVDKPPKKPPRLSLDTCEDFLNKIIWDREQLENDWNPYKTFNFIVTVNHLYKDWVEKVGSKKQKNRKRKVAGVGKSIFHCIGDLANASKHWNLDKNNQERQIVDAVSTPVIGDWYSHLIAGPVIYVEFNGSRLSMPELAEVAVKCLNWIIYGPEEFFPSDLEMEIKSLLQATKVSR